MLVRGHEGISGRIDFDFGFGPVLLEAVLGTYVSAGERTKPAIIDDRLLLSRNVINHSWNDRKHVHRVSAESYVPSVNVFSLVANSLSKRLPELLAVRHLSTSRRVSELIDV